MAALKSDVARTLRALGDPPAGAGSAVTALAELERVKVRMEAACSTLKARAPRRDTKSVGQPFVMQAGCFSRSACASPPACGPCLL